MDRPCSLSDSESSFFFNNRVFRLTAIVFLVHLSGCITSVNWNPESWSISSSNLASKYPTLSFITSLAVRFAPSVAVATCRKECLYSADHGQPCISLEMCGLVLKFLSLKTAWIIGPGVNLDKFERKLLNFYHLDCDKCLYKALFG